MEGPDGLGALPVAAMREAVQFSLVHSGNLRLDPHASERSRLAVKLRRSPKDKIFDATALEILGLQV